MGLLRRVRAQPAALLADHDQPPPQLRVWRGNNGAGDWMWRITSPDGRWLANDSAPSHDEAMAHGLAALRAATSQRPAAPSQRPAATS